MNKDIIITCSTCENDMEPFSCKFRTYENDCLKIIPYHGRDNYKHPNYPNIKRKFDYYEYRYWKPINYSNDYILSDEDFEL
jgi:hypothetical protein